jgi:hypothetical protein
VVFISLYTVLLVLDIWLMRRYAGREPLVPEGEGAGEEPVTAPVAPAF